MSLFHVVVAVARESAEKRRHGILNPLVNKSTDKCNAVTHVSLRKKLVCAVGNRSSGASHTMIKSQQELTAMQDRCLMSARRFHRARKKPDQGTFDPRSVEIKKLVVLLLTHGTVQCNASAPSRPRCYQRNRVESSLDYAFYL